MKRRSRTGAVIFFDGPDGVGKTVQLQLAAKELRTQGYKVHTSRVMGGTPFGELLRAVALSDTERVPLTDLYVSRAMHAELAHDLQRRRSEGSLCLIDRSPASMWSYQICAGGLDAQRALPIIDKTMRSYGRSLLIIYTAAFEVLSQRIAHRGEKSDYFESNPPDYHARVIHGYAEVATILGGTVVDATLTVEQVHYNTMELILNHLAEQP